MEFASQTGKSCAYCHPLSEGGGGLTEAGQSFKANNFRLAENAQPSCLAKAFKMFAGYLHVLVAVVWFGAIFYVHLFIKPQALKSGLPQKEKNLGRACIVVLILTGVALTFLRVRHLQELWTTTFGLVLTVKVAAFACMAGIALYATTRLDRRMRRQDEPSSLFAYDRALYDVTGSKMWKNGVHMGRHRTGEDLTEAMADAPHGPEVLDRVEKVGPVPEEGVPAATAKDASHRTFVFLSYVNLSLMLLILFCISYWRWGPPLVAPVSKGAMDVVVSAESQRCIDCHLDEGVLPLQIEEWRLSLHAGSGIGCYECHSASDKDSDGHLHHGRTVSTIVSPKDCSSCHEAECSQFQQSRHAQGGQILASLDNYLGEVVEGLPAAITGCRWCHGAEIEVQDNGRLSSASWPNTGIGRINPDGSLGSCSACHPRHRFASAVARRPENCGRCHLGPDHPQFEIYQESKHGIAFVEAQDRMNLGARDWRLGDAYTAAPTCVTCHHGANSSLEFTHDVGTRIAWTLRPEISVRLEDWKGRRDRMKVTCRHCHSPGWTDHFFSQFDNVVHLYNTKFASPAQGIMDELKKKNKITPTPFDEEIEWTYFLLWHHEGRRARHGASMMGPDYTQWHGFFEVAERFYMEFLPQAEELSPGISGPVLDADEHRWLEGAPKELRQRIESFYRERYESQAKGSRKNKFAF